jgi:Mrp family chromosome partitioning ATPase
MLADAIPLMRLVSGVIVVGQLGRITRDDAIHLRDQLRNVEAPTLGVVANRVRAKGRGYGYGYYGAYSGHDGTGGSGNVTNAKSGGVRIAP